MLLTSNSESELGPADDFSAVDYPSRFLDRPYRSIEGEAVILDLESGRIHQLNSTATFVWKCCDGTLNVQAIAFELAQAFDVDEITALEDTKNIIRQLQELNLIERNRYPKINGPEEHHG